MPTRKTVPFFQSSIANTEALSYGDPRGGVYPDPTEFFDDESTALAARGQSPIPSEDHAEYQMYDNDDEIYINNNGDGYEEDDDDNNNDNNNDNEIEMITQDEQMLDRHVGEFPSSDSELERERIIKSRRINRTRRQIESLDNKSPRRRGRKKGQTISLQGHQKRSRRKKKEPMQSPEFKRLNGLVTNAWMNHDYDTALTHALAAIQINSEYFPLHAIIAEILVQKGRPNDAIGALFTGVHSSRDPDNWWFVVNRLEELNTDDPQVSKKLAYCYSTLVSMRPDDISARLGRAATYLMNAQYGRAINDCEILLEKNSLDGRAVDIYSKACMELEEPEKAASIFEDFIQESIKFEPDTVLSWVNVTNYIDLLVRLEDYSKALQQLRKLSRFMLQRGNETFWDRYDDDREWDFDSTRRNKVREYKKSKNKEIAYGDSLPIESRIKLGVLRVLINDDKEDGDGTSYLKEGLQHLNFLIDTEIDDTYVSDFEILFKEAGDCLRETGHHEEALKFYEPLLQRLTGLDAGFYFDIAISYQALGRTDDVRSAIDHIKYGEDNPMAQIGLAKLYQANGRIDLMWRLILQLKQRDLHDMVYKAGLPLIRPADISEENEANMEISQRSLNKSSFKSRIKPGKSKVSKLKRDAETLRGIIVKSMYDDLKKAELGKKEGDKDAKNEWMRIASELYQEFSSQSRFFVKDRSKPFLGNAWEKRELRLENIDILNPNKLEFEKPKEWRQITLDEWTLIIAQYGISLAEEGSFVEARNVLNMIGNSTIVYPEPERLHIIRSVSFKAALLANDEEWSLEECRWFTKTSEFATDSFRLPSAALRSLHTDLKWYHDGPEQKFWLRQIRIMDFAILKDVEKAAFHFTDDNRAALNKNGGNPFNIEELDPELFVLYGHQMAVGSSPVTALNYYMRAYAIRPNDPTLHFCIGLAYLNLAFRRQTFNRQAQVQHGLAFLTRYYDARKADVRRPRKRMEAELNMGLVWQALGLNHLALPALDRCLALTQQVRREQEEEHAEVVEDFSPEAALAKRNILAASGDVETALKVTKRYLVL